MHAAPSAPSQGEITIRPATPQDASVFVTVFDRASLGLAACLWRKNAEEGEDIYAYANRRMVERLKDPKNHCLVAEVDGVPAGAIITYDIGDTPEDIDDDAEPIVVPLMELENKALETHYVNAISVFDGFEGRGIGTRLLRAVAGREGRNGMSLIIEDDNLRARALYEREGYREVASRPVVGDGWNPGGEAFILMVRPPVG